MWEIVGIALTSIIGFIVLFFMLLYGLSGGMRRAAQGFLNELKAGEYEKAYEYLSEKIKKDVWLEDFEQFLYMRDMSDFTDYRYNDFNVAASGNNGEFKTNLMLSNGGVTPLSLSFEKVNGKWRIYYIDIKVRVASSVIENNVVSIAEQENTKHNK